MTSKNEGSDPASGVAPATPCASGVAGCTAAAAPPADPWLVDILKIMCPKDKAHLDAMRAKGVTMTVYDQIYFEDPYYDGTNWTTKRFDAGGTTSASGSHINVVKTGDPAADAQTIYHEGVHTMQPAAMSWRDKEYEAYTKTEQWAIDHGQPETHPGFRATDASGNSKPDDAAIKSFVDAEYPGVSAAAPPPTPPPPPAGPAAPTPPPPPAPPPPDQVIGKDAAGNTMLQRDDGTTYTRPPKAGDSFSGPEITVPAGGRPVASAQLKCP